MIRCFSLSDLDRILEIERQSFPKSPYDRTTLINLYWFYPETFMVYLDEECLIRGYIVFSQDGHIISIAVHLQARRRGIGRELLQKVTHSPKVRKVWAEVRKSNEGAQAFYRKMGFQTVGTIPNYYGNEDAWVVQWTPSHEQDI
jgi:[ribosomal protein S18]-alanine N-acetyltransferase